MAHTAEADRVMQDVEVPYAETRELQPAPQPRATVVRNAAATDEAKSAATDWPTHSEDITLIAAALAQAQGEFGEIERTLRAQIESRRGASFGFEYEDLSDVIAAIRPHLSKHKIAVLQFPTTRQGGVVVQTLLAHESGQWFRNRLGMACDVADPHAVGSAITYARRYALKSLLCLAPSQGEDDDGAAAKASASAQRGAPRPAQRASQQPQPERRPAAPPSGAPAPQPIGHIRDIAQRTGGVLVELDSGFVFAVRDQQLIDALSTAQKNNARIEAHCQASSDPSKYAPRLTEFTVV